MHRRRHRAPVITDALFCFTVSSAPARQYRQAFYCPPQAGCACGSGGRPPNCPFRKSRLPNSLCPRFWVITAMPPLSFVVFAGTDAVFTISIRPFVDFKSSSVSSFIKKILCRGKFIAICLYKLFAVGLCLVR